MKKAPRKNIFDLQKAGLKYTDWHDANCFHYHLESNLNFR